MFENTTKSQATEQIFCRIENSHQICGSVARLENTARVQSTRLSATREHIFCSRPIFGNIWKYNKIVRNEQNFLFIEATKYFAMFENTTGLEATGEIEVLEATQYFAIFENTTRFSAARKYLNYWRHQICDNVREYHKIAGHGEKLKLLQPPNDFDFWRYHKIARNGENSIYWSHQKGNAQRVKFRLFNLKPPTRQCLKIPQNCRPRTKYFARFENTTRFPATGTFKSLKQPYMWQCLKIPQDCRPWRKIENIEATQISPNMWQCLKIPQDGRPRGKI